MGTRSTISAVNKDGTVTHIYCHWDGYIEHNGRLLLKYYDTERKVRQLLALRSLSTLGEIIGKKHKFDSKNERNPKTGLRACTSHYRDRGETVEVHTVAKPEDIPGEEYNYLWRDGKWEWSEDCRTWQLLVPEVVATKLEAA